MVLQVLDFFKHACSDVATKLSRNDWGRSKGKFRWFKSGFTGHWGNCTEAAEALETFGGKVMNRLVCMQSTKFVRSKRCHDNMVSLAINLNWRMSNGTWPMPNWILYMGSSIGVRYLQTGEKRPFKFKSPKSNIFTPLRGRARTGIKDLPDFVLPTVMSPWVFPNALCSLQHCCTSIINKIHWYLQCFFLCQI